MAIPYHTAKLKYYKRGGGGGGLLRSPPAAPNSDTFHHIAAHMYAIRCYKQGYEKADLAYAGSHRDCPVLASVAQWPEMQPLVSRGQTVSADLL